MIKRSICILFTVLMVLTTLVACGRDIETSSDSNTSESQTTLNSEQDFVNSSVESDNEVSTDLTSSSNSSLDSSSVNSGTSNSKNNSTTSNVISITTSSNNQYSSTNNSSSNNSNNSNNTGNVTQLVIKNDNSLYKDYPEITTEYLYPDKSVRKVSSNNSGIYENRYAKIDVTTGKQGYLLITYKEPWAEKIIIALDESATHSGKYVKTHYYYYNKGDFSLNEPIAIALPKTDAIYYITVSSIINKVDSIKVEIDLGQITVDGYASYQDMVPTEEQIKMSKVSSGVYANKYVKINTNTANKGYVEVEYLDTKGYDIKVTIRANKKNQYGISASWQHQTSKRGNCKIKAALTYGNAEYTINVLSTMKNDSTGVERVSKKATLTINLTNVSTTGAFLLNEGEVEFNSNMAFIKKANEIAATCSNDFEKVSKIYDWLTDYIKYRIVEETEYGRYKCDIEKIYNRKTGVCYDYAVVLAAMLRSQGIPCKVVFGKYANDTTDIGHAWNEIYISSSGSIDTSKISIVGNKWCRLDPTLSSGSKGDAPIDYMNNDNNYTWRYYY